MLDDPSEQELAKLKGEVQEAILRNYPNPERRGCPGSDVLQQFASRTRPLVGRDWDHATHCSPCYREFLELRASAKQAVEEPNRQPLVLRQWMLVACAAFVVVCLSIFLISRTTPGTPEPQQVVSVDLKDYPILRGPAPDSLPGSRGALVLPRQVLQLRLTLPLGSEPGRYEVQFFRETDAPPLWTTSARAVEEDGLVILTFNGNFGFQPGSYQLGIRRDDWAWRYYPVRLD